MGIPAYFRWISEKYPRIMESCIEYVKLDQATGEEHLADALEPNPNGLEFHNLYLDMNGIIHPCTHPEDGPAPKNEPEMFKAIFDYIDRIFAIVRPRKLLYLAIDGVAPRAKINQQRSRRFRAAQEHQQKLEAQRELLTEWAKQYQLVDDDHSEAKESAFHFDSNVITPGTPFMARLAVELRAYVAHRIEYRDAWRDIVVVFSDASVPGEGEHKIAEFIRRERAQPGYNPSIRHVMYGLDADLIMLALATHEANFTILREEVFPKRDSQRQEPPSGPVMRPDHSGHTGPQEMIMKLRSELGGKKPFHFLHVHTLREYLEYEFKDDIAAELSYSRLTNIDFDLERVIDDFVFMCFFVGNDFLPHLPTLDIREGAIDFLIELYKTEVVRIGYLTSANGEIDFTRVRQLLRKVSEKEEEIFKERLQRRRVQDERAKDQQRHQQEAEKKKSMKRCHPDLEEKSVARKTEGAHSTKRLQHEKKRKDHGYQEAFFRMPTVELGRKTGHVFGLGNSVANSRVAEGLKANLKYLKQKKVKEEHRDASKSEAELLKEKDSQLEKTSEDHSKETVHGSFVQKTKAEYREALNQRLREKSQCDIVDSVMLGEEGWKERYYDQKFKWGANHRQEKRVLVQKYNEGLQWVMKYYYVGCVSWGWYYPFHYAPFASDLVDSDCISSDMKFEMGKPFEPFTQLQAVMPASSGKLVLPTCYSDLMVNPNSPIIDYYPADFDVDLNGKRYAWQGVVLLPFIDELRLHSALMPLKEKLSEEEIRRNAFGETYIMIHGESNVGRALGKKTIKDGKKTIKDGKNVTEISPAEASGFLFGKVSDCTQYCEGTRKVLALTFEVPEYRPHRSEILPGAILPPLQLDVWEKAKSRSCGWRPARFGPLGRAARDIIVDRQRRMAMTGRRNREPTRVKQELFEPDRPVINWPLKDVGSSMFAELGGSASCLPRWVRGEHAKQTRRGGHGSGGWRQGGFGVETDPYRPASKDGGHYANARHVGKTSTAWGSGTSWHTQAHGQRGNMYRQGYRDVEDIGRHSYGQQQAYDGSYGRRGWSVEQNNCIPPHQSQGHFYTDHGDHYQNLQGCSDGDRVGRGGSGRGLSGPTAASLRRGRGERWITGKPGRGGSQQ